jgi:Zn-dependent protease with chaperone function
MDFFDRQDKARRKTKWLVFYFVLAVMLTIGAIYLALAAIVLHKRFTPETLAWLWEPGLFYAVAGGTLLVITAGSVYKMIELRRGGTAVALSLGGVPLDTSSAGPDERKLLNVVEEMALASGTPVPDVYVLRGERGINAFAAGRSPTDAVIGVTEGCMKLLTRDELQGVIAHEFSHILNGDMRLNLRLMGVVHGIVCVAIIGRVILEVSMRAPRRLGARGGGRGGNPLPLIGLVLLVIGYIGVFFARLIKSAISRQREFLADAAAVQFTRLPEGLAGALKKIGGLWLGSRVTAPVAEEASHMFFGNALGEAWFGLMSTHPPLVQRIQAIEPNFDGRFAPVVVEAPPVQEPFLGRQAGRQRGFGGLSRLPFGQGALPAPAILAAALMPQVGIPTPEHLRYAAGLRAALPDTLVEATRDSLGATALVYSFLLGAEETLRASQLQYLGEHVSTAVGQETTRLVPATAGLPPGEKLALVDLALPALRRLSPAQYQQFLATVKWLVESDQQIDLFEYTLQKIATRHLAPHFEPLRKTVTQYYALRPLVRECVVLLSILAHVGHEEAARKEAAFRTGAQALNLTEPMVFLLDSAECNLAQVDAALTRLNQAAPSIKRGVLNACALTVAADGMIQEKEAELLRAIADTLDCPIPPFIHLRDTEAQAA